MPYKSPLSRDQYDQLRKDKSRLVEVLEGAERAESCGIDCQGQKGAAQQLLTALENYEKHFFTPPPK